MKKENNEDINTLGDWYHSFESLGIDNLQKGGIYPLNQVSKEGIILSYLRLAIEKTKASSKENISVLDLFSADCYYAFYAEKYGANIVHCVDSDKLALQQAKILINKWNIEDKIKIFAEDVFKFENAFEYDIVLCCGGLYHIYDPPELIKKIADKHKPNYLIIQTACSLNKLFDFAPYFESPAPGWTWGCRFNKSYLNDILLKNNFSIVDFTFNELEGNERVEDRGSMYYLLKRK